MTCRKLSISFHRNQKFQLSDKQIASIKQALSELTLPELAELQDCFQDYFSDFWLESRFENEKHRLSESFCQSGFSKFQRLSSRDAQNLSDFSNTPNQPTSKQWQSC